MMTSLDHAMWFHKPFRADEWMLYELETTQSGAGRGFANARLWSQNGRLVASTAQEGVIRATLAKPKL
jgi:acyl-CoA thioesterase II